MKKLYILLSFASIIFLAESCGNAEEIITPSHYSRVPRPVNLSANYDTTSSGKYRIFLSWNVESTNNLKDFEIYRSVNSNNFFFLVGGIISTSYIDSTLSNSTDSLKVAYYVNGRGIDRFVGQSSDTISIIITKIF